MRHNSGDARARLRRNSLVFTALTIIFFVLVFTLPPLERPPEPRTANVAGLAVLFSVGVAVIYGIKWRRASKDTSTSLTVEEQSSTQRVADEVETMAEKHGLAPTLALMNTARIEIVRVLNENPQGLTEHEVTDSLGTTQMAYSLKLHLEALLAAEAIRFDGGRYYSMVDEETLRRMEDAKDRDYDRDAVQRH